MMHGGGNGWNNAMEPPLASGTGKLEKLPNVIPSRAEIRKQVDEAGLDKSAYGFTWMDATLTAPLFPASSAGPAW